MIMIEVHERLFVGAGLDFLLIANKANWAVVQAAKEPWHREALGYRGRSAPLSDPERFVAVRGNRLILNMIDADKEKYYPRVLFDRALAFIHEHYEAGKNVLVHCNQGQSRSPSIVLLYMARCGFLPSDSFSSASYNFIRLYPSYSPSLGIREFLESNWQDYVNG